MLFFHLSHLVPIKKREVRVKKKLKRKLVGICYKKKYQIGIVLPKQYEIGKNMLIPSLSTHIISTKQYEKEKSKLAKI
ncbi:hypothetical protein D8B35_02515 [Lactococcus laudensis]|nr:hypothetical protein [Lactococcus laudensis]